MNFDQVFLATARFTLDAQQRRVPYRESHLAHVRSLLDDGTALVAGALADMSASVLVLRAEDERAARAVLEHDPYWRHGIWTSIEVVAYLAATVESIRS